MTNILMLLLFLSLGKAQEDQDGSTTENPEEEWHMDFMPVGYLPDSVYRDLAWYGINQIQPFLLSSKNRMVAMLIWQHTLGRPHVIMETPPHALNAPGKVSRQILAEEASKWSREQRTKQEILMETIKSGGNGVTIRTVVSATNTTTLGIVAGYYYACPEGTEPDLDKLRKEATFHSNITCTYGKVAEPLSPNIDPCIDAETTPPEYSFNEGWMFCLGTEERDAVYHPDGTLDCGNKTKVSVDDFLKLCAIDNNVVITFDYFGDEPRKDVVHNASLCSTWDPCRISYLYRFETPPLGLQPAFPSSTENPCETTVCEDCLEGFTGPSGVEVNIDSPGQPEIFRKSGPVSLNDLIKPCRMDDMECIRETTHQFLERASDGIPQYGIKAMDPLRVDKLNYDLVDFGCSHHVSNLRIIGLKQLQVSDFKIDTANRKVTLSLSISVNAEGDLAVDYHVKPKQKTINGHYTSEFKIMTTVRYPYSTSKGADGAMHYEVGKEVTTFELEDTPRFTLNDEFTKAVAADPDLTEARKKELGRREEFNKILAKQLIEVIVPTLIHNLRLASKMLPVTAFIIF